VKVYTLSAEADLDTLVAQLTDDLTASSLTQNVVLVLIKDTVENVFVDTVVERVQLAAIQVNANTLMVLSGTEGALGFTTLSLV
jgi:hypothetical protein